MKRISVGGVCLVVFLFASVSQATTLSTNIADPSAGTETASGSNFLTASFQTDSSSYNFLSVALLLQQFSSGSTTLALYSDGVLEPGIFLTALTSPSSYSSTLVPTIYSGSAALSANTKYWLVLSASSGSFGWSWTTGAGSGPGFLGEWGSSSDSGATWFTTDTFPLQMSVDATSEPLTVPETSTSMLLIAGIGAHAIAAAFLGLK
jgi:hypothetical protein